MKSVRPIETQYKGYRFRSRLEARWAVFFDELGVAYEYELEGFSLPSGKSYLPDFYLPDIGVFVEVKPTKKMPYGDLHTIVEFALEGDHHLLLIIGTPTQETMYLINRMTCEPLDEFAVDYHEYEGAVDKNNLVEIYFETLGDWAKVEFGYTPFEIRWTLVFKDEHPFASTDLRGALLKAKQARFEFGEIG